MPVYDTPTSMGRLTTRETEAAGLVDWAAARDVYDGFTRPGLDVGFVIAPTFDDTCAGCPDAQTTPNDAEAVIVYRRAGSAWTYRVPVARCCAGTEINQLLTYPVPTELRVEIPVPTLDAAAA